MNMVSHSGNSLWGALMNSREKTPKPFYVEFRIWHLHDVRIQSNKHQKKSRGYLAKCLRKLDTYIENIEDVEKFIMAASINKSWDSIYCFYICLEFALYLFVCLLLLMCSSIWQNMKWLFSEQTNLTGIEILINRSVVLAGNFNEVVILFDPKWTRAKYIRDRWSDHVYHHFRHHP